MRPPLSFAFSVCLALAACSSSDETPAFDDLGDLDRVPDCEEPHGDIHRVTSVSDGEVHIEGAWRLCSGSLGSVLPADVAGIVIDEGKMRSLSRSGERFVRSAPAGDARIVDEGPDLHRRFANVVFVRDDAPRLHGFRVSENGAFLVLDDVDSDARASFVRVRPRGWTSSLPEESAPAPSVAKRFRVSSGTLRARPDARGLELAGAQAFVLVEAGEARLERTASWDDVLDMRTRPAGGEPGALFVELSNLSGVWGYMLRQSADGRVVTLTEVGRDDDPLVLGSSDSD
jgi:hypothetical protein